MPTVLIDSGVWYALFDSRDGAATRDTLERMARRIEPMSIIVPWPTAYETLRTKFVKNRMALAAFERQMRAANIAFVDDVAYRDEAFQLALDSTRRNRPLSMVDCLMRLMLDDRATRIGYLATFNIPDFFDVCHARGISILSHDV